MTTTTEPQISISIELPDSHAIDPESSSMMRRFRKATAAFWAAWDEGIED